MICDMLMRPECQPPIRCRAPIGGGGGGEAKEVITKTKMKKKNTQKKTWTQLKRPRDNIRQRRRITQSKSKTRNYNGHRHCNLRNNVGYQVKTRFLSSLGSFVQSFSKKATTLWSSRFCGRRPNKRKRFPVVISCQLELLRRRRPTPLVVIIIIIRVPLPQTETDHPCRRYLLKLSSTRAWGRSPPRLPADGVRHF